jgi:hypothetical protein
LCGFGLVFIGVFFGQNYRFWCVCSQWPVFHPVKRCGCRSLPH